MTINLVLANVIVEDIDLSLPLYRTLSGVSDPVRFTFRDLELAIVGNFLLVSGHVDNHPRQVASLLVPSIRDVTSALTAAGAELLEGPAPTENAAHRLVARHPDGSVFEYLQIAEGGQS